MNSSLLIRAAAPSAALAALVGIPADLYHFTITSRAEAAGELLFRLHGLGLMVAFLLVLVALMGTAARVGPRLGRGGAVGVTAAFAGTVLVLGDLSRETFWTPLAPELLDVPAGAALAMVVGSFALFSAGWLLLGVAVARTGLVALPAAVLLGVGAFVAFTPVPGAYILLLAGIAAVTRSLATQESPDRNPLAAPGVRYPVLPD
jgi:hypothetical protein